MKKIKSQYKYSQMRLIDANKLELNSFIVWDLKTGADCKTQYFFEQSEIDNAPTVEAIPIDWLLAKKEVCKQPLGKAIYDEIIKQWREENESNKQDN